MFNFFKALPSPEFRKPILLTEVWDNVILTLVWIQIWAFSKALCTWKLTSRYGWSLVSRFFEKEAKDLWAWGAVFFRQAIPIPREQIPAPSLNKTEFVPYGSRAACVELHNCWLCFLEETPALFLSCVFLNSARAFPHLASWVFHFLSTFPCQGAFLSLPRKCLSRAPARLRLPSILCSKRISSQGTPLTGRPRWRPPRAQRFPPPAKRGALSHGLLLLFQFVPSDH